MRFDLVVVGHIVLDFIKRGGKTEGPRIGGPCVYSSLAGRSLCARVALVSNVGQDFGKARISWLRDRGVSVTNIRVAGSNSAKFWITYTDGRRSMKVPSTCGPFEKGDLSRIPTSSAVHLGPVLQEIPTTLATELVARDSVVALDPQGYFRRLATDGTVRVRKWRNEKLLKRVDVLKISDSEVSAILDRSATWRELPKLGPNIVLLTRGAEGTIVWSRDHGAFKVPAFPARVRNPTGAGDALLGAFLVTWVRTSDLLWSASIGGAIASFLIESGRPARFGTRKQIEKRATAILDQTTKL
jgi:sugar/nucleoside kinase (ribokinase family)